MHELKESQPLCGGWLEVSLKDFSGIQSSLGSVFVRA